MAAVTASVYLNPFTTDHVTLSTASSVSDLCLSNLQGAIGSHAFQYSIQINLQALVYHNDHHGCFYCQKGMFVAR